MIEKLIEDGEYQKAIEEIGPAEDEKSLFQKASCQYGLANLDKALDTVNLALTKTDNYYYPCLSLKINILMDLDKDAEAINILEEELSMPYIPMKYEEFFSETYNRLLKKRKGVSNNYSPYDLLNDEELAELISPNKSNEVVSLVIYQLRKRNIRLFLEVIKTFFKSSAPAFLKTMLIEVLADQKVNEDFIIKHKNLELEVNPTLVTPFMEQDSIKAVLDLVHTYNSDNNLTINQDAYDILLTYLSEIYPVEVEEDEYPYLAAAIYYYCLANYDEDVELAIVCGRLEVKRNLVEAYYDALLDATPIY